MTEKPDFVLNFSKPKNTEIKGIRGNWYLYERLSKYDPVKKRSKKISGKCLGKLTPEGLVPTKRRLTSIASQENSATPNVNVATSSVSAPSVAVSDVVEVGGALFLLSRTNEMRARLQKYFPELWQRIFVTVLLRALKGPRFRRLQTHYETNFLAYVYPDLAFTPQLTASFLQDLGRQRDAIAQYMKEDVKSKDVFILFDGHRLITSSKTMELAEFGYDSKRRFMPQINLLYVYSLGSDTATPVYYKQYLGSTPDVNAFPDILQECGISCKDYTIVADKGFASEEDFNELTKLELSYIIPIKRGSRIVAQDLPLERNSYTDVFTYNSRAIQAFKIEKDGFNLFVYFDAQLYANELADTVERASKRNELIERKIATEQKRRNKGLGRLSDEELEKLHPEDLQEILAKTPEMGTFTLRTNRLDLNSQQIYRTYKQRQAIEQFFKTYGDSMNFEASYMRNQRSQEAWLFLNHLSASIATECLNDIANIGEDQNISFEDLRQTLSKIMATKINDRWSIAPIKNAVKKLMSKLNFTINDNDLLALLPPKDTP